MMPVATGRLCYCIGGPKGFLVGVGDWHGMARGNSSAIRQVLERNRPIAPSVRFALVSSCQARCDMLIGGCEPISPKVPKVAIGLLSKLIYRHSYWLSVT